MSLILNNAVIQTREGDDYVNATQLCQIGNKRFNNWRRNKMTSDFLDVLERQTRISAQHLIETEQRGNSLITWVHPKVAINIALWLSPEFNVLVSEWVYTLLTKGQVELNNSSLKMITEQYEKIESQNERITALESIYTIANKVDELEQYLYITKSDTEDYTYIFAARQLRNAPYKPVYKIHSNNPIRLKNAIKAEFRKEDFIKVRKNSFVLSPNYTMEDIIPTIEMINDIEYNI